MRIRRADLPEQNSQAVYQRMQTERQREAAEFRAQGGQKAQEIRSNADREATVIVAEANSKAEQIRGEGDAERNRLFAEAYGKDPDFFAFYRSMTAYENGLKSSDTRFLLQAGFRFLPVLRQSRQARRRRRRRSRKFRRRRQDKTVLADKNDKRGGSSPMRSIAFADFLIGLGILFVLEGCVCGEPGLDAPGDEKRAGDARQHPARRRHRLGGRGPDPDLGGPPPDLSADTAKDQRRS